MWKDHTKQGSAISRHVGNCFERNTFGAARQDKKMKFDPDSNQIQKALKTYLKAGGKITKIDTHVFNTENLFNK